MFLRVGRRLRPRFGKPQKPELRGHREEARWYFFGRRPDFFIVRICLGQLFFEKNNSSNFIDRIR